MFRYLICVFFALFAATFAAYSQNDDEREGGIIGTGIVGTITHLGSIYVNGQHIRFDDGLPVGGAIGAETATDLRPGHTVAVRVQPDGTDWQALDIQQVFPLVGPIDTIDGANLTVMGTHVVLGTPPAGLVPGDWVAVSGLWRGDDVVASRLDRAPDSYRTARLTGTLLAPAADGRLRIGGSEITGIAPRHLSPGALLRVFGRPTPGGIEADRLETELFDEGVGIIQVEGFYSRPQPDGLYTVLGSGLVAYTDRPEMISNDQKVVRCGQDGKLVSIPAAEVEDAQDGSIPAGLGCGQ